MEPIRDPERTEEAAPPLVACKGAKNEGVATSSWPRVGQTRHDQAHCRHMSRMQGLAATRPFNHELGQLADKVQRRRRV